MKSTNINDYEDQGCNAEWCISAYYMDSDHIVFDNEDDTFSLCFIVPDASCEEEVNNLTTGTFEECVNYFNKEVENV